MPYQREVRLGIVLYGGVSLAVYENGIAQELHRAIRGDGVYGLLKDLIDSDIVVDIISGTSAGGVNGIMLAYALANKRSFAPSADLWREQGDIQALLRTEGDVNGASILNSDYYQEKLEDCFKYSLAMDRTAPPIEELDLFITGTDANGAICTVYDDQGHAVDVKNHRALFRLSVRKGNRKNDLATATPAELAKLARLTSCFPVAFEPVRITPAEEHFFRWGKLRAPAVYMDGGILNNKPFTSTIDAIFKRAAHREVERFIIYVEPDPEIFADQISSDAPRSPSVIQAAASSVISIPGYQSIASDLEEIESHNERAQRIASMFEAIGDAPETGADCLDRVAVLPEETGDSDNQAYLACRVIQLRDSAVEGILNDEDGRGYIASPADRRSGRILVESFNYWPGDLEETLTQYDVFFRMRRVSHLCDSMMRRLKARDLSIDSKTWELANHYSELYEMTQWAMATWLNKWEFDWQRLGPAHPHLDTLPKDEQRKILEGISANVWGQVKERLGLLLYAGVEVPAAPTPEARAKFYVELTGKLSSDSAPAEASPQNLLHAIDRSLTTALKALGQGDIARLLRNEFCRFAEIDRQLFPIQMGSGFESTNVLRVVRFSPRDAQRGLSKGPASTKVCGSALGAFGGFFKKSWRANDIMIGRLDAACQLLECLLTKERLADLPKGRSFTPAQLTGCFPHIGDDGAASLANTINDFLKEPHAGTQDTWDELIDEMVAACHREIQVEEWPRVIASAMEQEHQWGRYLRKTTLASEPFDSGNLAWNRAKEKPDEVLMAVAANAIASGTIPPFKPGSIAGRPFLDELPETVVAELGFLAGIRVGKSMLDSIPNPETRRKLEGRGVYQWPFGRILPLLYRWARMRRTKPESVIVLNTAVPVVCLTVLILDVVLLILGIQMDWGLRAGLAAAPVMVLFVWWLWFRK